MGFTLFSTVWNIINVNAYICMKHKIGYTYIFRLIQVLFGEMAIVADESGYYVLFRTPPPPSHSHYQVKQTNSILIRLKLT